MTDAPDIFIFNTLSKRKEALVTAESDRVTLYVCGPTVYNYSHLGNARPAVVFDLLVNLLKTRYSEVAYARNFTDIDDKINHAAAAEGSSIDTVATRFINAYHRDMDALGVARPQWEPRVTHHIPQIIALIARLLKKGHAYSHKGHVLFSIVSYPEYGLLSGRNMNSVSATVPAHDRHLGEHD
ncbi:MULTISPECIES: hypothetical protein [unclassified Marinobacter]|uniref:hypothetical protein n=1 Tax=unclassified Marinobacter TaxID=83889 RepID=UPI000BF3CF3F|nr:MULTISPECIES: hypothetical protein [unclassified Marinobacter]